MASLKRSSEILSMTDDLRPDKDPPKCVISCSGGETNFRQASGKPNVFSGDELLQLGSIYWFYQIAVKSCTLSPRAVLALSIARQCDQDSGTTCRR
jgi:hypothetical protein